MSSVSPVDRSYIIVACIEKVVSETITFVPLFGALLYYFLRRSERIKAVGR